MQVLEQQLNPMMQIKEHLKTLQKIKIAKAEKCDTLRQDLEELERPFNLEEEAIKGEIIKLMPEIEESIKTESGSVKYRKGTIRASYPRKEIDELLEQEPELKEKLLPYRREVKIKDSISIEVY